MTGTFVGKVPGTSAFVAVVAEAATDGGERRVLAYVCDEPYGWFPGSS